MTTPWLPEWRRRRDLTQRQAALALGISLSHYRQIEAGRRRDDGCPVTVPRTVALAAAAIELGITEYQGEVLAQQ